MTREKQEHIRVRAKRRLSMISPCTVRAGPSKQETGDTQFTRIMTELLSTRQMVFIDDVEQGRMAVNSFTLRAIESPRTNGDGRTIGCHPSKYNITCPQNKYKQLNLVYDCFMNGLTRLIRDALHGHGRSALWTEFIVNFLIVASVCFVMYEQLGQPSVEMLGYLAEVERWLLGIFSAGKRY